MDKGRFKEQARKAKEFYEKDVLSDVESRTNKELEFDIMSSKLEIVSDISNSVFMYLGAGTGRHIKELHKKFKPKKSIAIDISDRNIKMLKDMEIDNQDSLEIQQLDFFKIKFDKINAEKLFIFLNWTTLGEVGSKSGLIYLFKSCYSFPRDVTLIGDMPFQENYLKEIIEYKFSNKMVDLGVIPAPSEKNENNHLIYIPTNEELIKIAKENGFACKSLTAYIAQSGLKRYLFEFEKE